MAEMKKYVWFASAGPAEILFIPEDVSDLQCFLQALDKDIPVHVLGAGSNLIIRGGGVSGIVVRLSSEGFSKIDFDGDLFRAGAGVRDMALARYARDQKRTGLEFYAGIPGSVGGAVVMNAGACGSETSQRFMLCKIVDRAGRIQTVSNAEMGFSYRHSALPKDIAVIEVGFLSEKGEEEEIASKMKAMLDHRAEAQPKGVRTGGSTFKNPPGHKAWKLIDAAGCRGFGLDGAQMSPKHCNFMINTHVVSPDILEELGEIVRKRVYDHAQIMLEWEIKRIGMGL